MEYRVIRSEDRSDDVIEHDLFKGAGGKPLYGRGRQKGAQNKNHKYLARAWIQAKWRYAYTPEEVRQLQNWGKGKLNNLKDKAKEAGEKVSATAKKASDVATGKYAKAVDTKVNNAKQSIARATEARNQEQQKAASANARKENADNKLFKTKKVQQTSSNASASAERASANAQKYDEARSKAQADLASAAREKETTAYKVSKAVNDTTAKVKSTANKVADTAKDVTEKAKDAPRAAAEAVVNAAKSTVDVGKDIVSNFSDAAKEKAKEISEAWKDDGPRKVADAARDVSSQIGKSVKTAAEAATGKYSKDVDARLSKANENYNRASEDLEKQRQLRDAAGKRRSSGNENANAAYERASNNAKEAERKAASSKFEQLAIQKEQKSTAYKVSEGVNNAKDKVSETAKKAGDTAKSVADKGKAKVDELFSGIKKTDNQSETVTRSSDSEVTRGRKYEGTGHKAEARKEEGGVAGGPVSGNTNMQGRGEEKKTTLKDKVSDFAKKASNAAEAVKLGAHLTKKNVENYLNDDNGKVVTDTAGKSTLKGQKVTTTYSEGNGLLNKSTLTKKQNEDGTVEYEHHTEYGKIAQTAKKGKEAVENLFGDKKTPKYSITPNKLEEYTPPWLEGYHFKNGKIEVDKSVAETFEKGKSKAKEVLDKVSSTAKTTAAKAYDKVTDTAEKVADKVEDIKVNAEHKAYANEMKRKYGADSLHYKDAQAYVEHDKTVSDLQKARDKYGVNSAEYKAAAAKEKTAREKMDDVHEQNLYTNNKEYKKISDQASALGSYIDNMDARGGPQTAEGKANYRKAVQDLEKLEAELERMWNEDWE